MKKQNRLKKLKKLPDLPPNNLLNWKLGLGVCLVSSFLFSASQAPELVQAENLSLIHPSKQNQLPVDASSSQQLVHWAQTYHLPMRPIDSLQMRVVRARVMDLAKKHTIPRAVALGVSGQESGGWNMWDNRTLSDVVQNQNPAMSGLLKSSDWGVMQINDLAHPKAFPEARQNMDFNIDYGLKFLSELHKHYKGNLNRGFGDWDITLATYNLGHPPTANEIHIAYRYLAKTRQILTQYRIPFELLYTVQADDTLESIAQKQLGSRRHWYKIWQSNRQQLRSPQTLQLGQILHLPSQ
jgi:hypothetical protein